MSSRRYAPGDLLQTRLIRPAGTIVYEGPPNFALVLGDARNFPMLEDELDYAGERYAVLWLDGGTIEIGSVRPQWLEENYTLVGTTDTFTDI